VDRLHLGQQMALVERDVEEEDSVALSVIGEVPVSTRCSWKLRNSSAVAVSGERLR